MKFSHYVALALCSILVNLRCGLAGRVLVAANEAAFKSLAKKFAPQKLAAQLASIVSGATEGYFNAATLLAQGQGQSRGEEYYEQSPNLNQGRDDPQQFAYEGQQDNGNVQSEEEDPQGEYVDGQEPAQDYQQKPELVNARNGSVLTFQFIKTTKKRPRTVQVNLDELVDKVRERLLKDFETTSLKTTSQTISSSQFPTEYVDRVRDDNRPVASENNEKQTKITTEAEASQAYLVNRPKIVPNVKKMPRKKTPIKTIESHGLYEKVKLNVKKDSYEDYVTPKKEADIFVSEEKEGVKSSSKSALRHDATPGVIRQQKRYQEVVNIGHVATTRNVEQPLRIHNYENINTDFDNGNSKLGQKTNENRNDASENMNSRNKLNREQNGYSQDININTNERPQPSKNYETKLNFEITEENENKNHKQTNDETQKEIVKGTPNSKDRNSNPKGLGNKYDMTYDDYKEATRNENGDGATTERDRQSVSPKMEYVDDEFTAVTTTISHVPKAATEFIGGPDYDYKNDLPQTLSTDGTTEPQGYVNTKRKMKKIATNMAIRQRYTINTPNYYQKLPRIAEKYNFDEPLPEKDREGENLKQIGINPASINGKVKV